MKKALLSLIVIAMSLLPGCGLGGLWGNFAGLLNIFNVRGIW